jgi:hypothetical protein
MRNFGTLLASYVLTAQTKTLPPQALVASWEGRTQSGEGLRNLVTKNGAGVTSASKFLHNLEYKQDIKKRRETCKSKWRLLGRGVKHFLTIRFVVHTNVARIKLPSLTKQV